jgi:hypothetical protein
MRRLYRIDDPYLAASAILFMFGLGQWQYFSFQGGA